MEPMADILNEEVPSLDLGRLDRNDPDKRKNLSLPWEKAYNNIGFVAIR